MTSRVRSYDIRSDAWSEEDVQINQARTALSASSFDSRIFIAGGCDENKNEIGTVEFIDLA